MKDPIDVPFDSRHLPVNMTQRSAFVEKAKTNAVRWATEVAHRLGKLPEDILLVNEVSIDGLKFRPVLNTEVLNLLYEDLEPGAIYRVGRLHLRRTVVILGVNEGALLAQPMVVHRK